MGKLIVNFNTAKTLGLTRLRPFGATIEAAT
jgi:hypothetical protein